MQRIKWVLVLPPVELAQSMDRWQASGVAGYLVKPVRYVRFGQTLVATTVASEAQFPVRVELDGPGMQLTEGSGRVGSSDQPLRLLLAEDNLVNQKLAGLILRKRGYQVTIVDNGRLALEALAREPFDLVLMDVQMPEMSGLEVVRALRVREAGVGHHMPVIAMTANAMKGDAENCLAAGMDDYIAKPMQAAGLYAVIDRVLARFVPRPNAVEDRQGT